MLSVNLSEISRRNSVDNLALLSLFLKQHCCQQKLWDSSERSINALCIFGGALLITTIAQYPVTTPHPKRFSHCVCITHSIWLITSPQPHAPRCAFSFFSTLAVNGLTTSPFSLQEIPKYFGSRRKICFYRHGFVCWFNRLKISVDT